MSAALILPHVKQRRAKSARNAVLWITRAHEIRWAATVRPYAAEGGGGTSSPQSAPARQFQATTTGGNRVPKTQRPRAYSDEDKTRFVERMKQAADNLESLESVVAELGISRNTLSYWFSRIEGKGFREYVDAKRVVVHADAGFSKVGKIGGRYSREFRAYALEVLARENARFAELGLRHSALEPVARALGVKSDTLAIWARGNSDPDRRTVRTTAEEHARRRAAFLAAKESGATISDVAAELGISRGALSKWAEKKLPEAERRHLIACDDTSGTPRKCLRCRVEFRAWGRGNHMCGDCRPRSHDDSPYAPDPGGHTGRRTGARRP